MSIFQNGYTNQTSFGLSTEVIKYRCDVQTANAIVKNALSGFWLNSVQACVDSPATSDPSTKPHSPLAYKRCHI